MPEHLYKIKLDTSDIIKNIYEVLKKQETTFILFLELYIEKYILKEVNQEALRLYRVA